MKTSNVNVDFTMIERDGKYYQRVQFFDWMFEVPFDIIFGSSKMAQTCAYWHGDRLYQLNVTYLTEIDDWINSPGFIDGDAAYARPLPARCVECHTTYADFREAPNSFTPDSIIFGVTCERCHGPGREHVDFHTQNPGLKVARHVVVPSDLPRDLELQICSQCHSGLRQLKGDPYQFRPGDDMSEHYKEAAANTENEVHTSNQQVRLALSKCYQESEMTCVSCHNPHQFERGNTKLFSKRCIQCHEPDACGMHQELGDRIADNCIDCHMPSNSGDFLNLQRGGEKVFPPLRDHHVKVDLTATERFLGNVDSLDPNSPQNHQ